MADEPKEEIMPEATESATTKEKKPASPKHTPTTVTTAAAPNTSANTATVTAPKKPQPTKPIQKNRKKKKREEGAPKFPQTGYVRYMNKRRDELKNDFPEKTAIEHTKMIAEEWNTMSDELKKPFLQAAEVDKERYVQQLVEYNKQKKEDLKEETLLEKTNQSSNGSNNGSKSSDKVQINGKDSLQTTKPRRSGEYSIPIFTDEFLEHNKNVDAELKMLRKTNLDYDQQNSVLEKHIENMKFGVEKMEAENLDLMEKNNLLQSYLDKLRSKLAQSLSGLAIPNEPNGATMENVDKYMEDLYGMATSNSHGPASLNKAKDIIRKLDLQIQL